MTEKEKFDKSVGVLATAYLNNTLQQLNCCACAIGNLVAAAMGYKYQRIRNSVYRVEWQDDIAPDWFDYLHEGLETDEAVEQIKAIGYTLEQTRRIETAFETKAFKTDLPVSEKEYLGLMRVVEVLADIHHVELRDVNEAKSMFVKV